MAISQDELSRYIDIAQRVNNRPDYGTELSSIIRGLDPNASNNLAVGPDDSKGLIFLARTDCNLDPGNLSQHRILSTLLASHENASGVGNGIMQATQVGAIRSLLDRRGNFDNRSVVTSTGQAGKVANTCSPLIDPYNTFFPIITNQAKSLSGTIDTALPTKVSPEGLYGQQHVISDARSDFYGNYKLTITCEEVRGRFIASLFAYLGLYQALIRDGRNTRNPKNIANHRIDYSMRAFHIALNRSKNKVVMIYDFTNLVFEGMNDGEAGNYDRDTLTPETGKDITLQFSGVGQAKYDPISRVEFNRMVASSKFSMYVDPVTDLAADESDVLVSTAYDRLVSQGMQLVQTPIEISLMSRFMYPRIDANMNMQWWVDADVYERRMNKYISLMNGSSSNDDEGLLDDVLGGASSVVDTASDILL